MLKYSSMPSMKMASGDLSARRRGTRWPSVSVAQRCSSLGVKSSRRTKWSMTLCSCASAIRPPSLASTLRPSVAPTCLSAASAIAASQTFDHGSGDAAKNGDRLAAEDLVADRLVEQVAARQADRVALALVEDALGLEEQRLAEALGADDDELVVAVRASGSRRSRACGGAATRRSPRRRGCRRRPRSTRALVASGSLACRGLG